MKKLLFIAIVLVTIGFTSSSKEEVAQQAAKVSVQKVNQTDVDAIKVVSTAKETTSWD